MKRKIFDMNQCKPGDQLMMMNGTKAMYKMKVDDYVFEKYFHLITYRNDCGRDCLVTRTDEGWYFVSGLASANDIVGFWEE